MHSQKGNILVVWLVIAALLWLIAITLGIGGPKSQVISQQLHDECWVFVWVLIECVQFGYRVIERLTEIKHIYNIRNHISLYIDGLTMQNAGKVNANANASSSSSFSVLSAYNESILIRLEVHSKLISKK